MFPLRQSTTTTVVAGPLQSPSDGMSPVLGLAVPASTKVFLAKNGTAAAYTIVGWTEVGNGLYNLTLSGTDTGGLGRLRIDFMDVANFIPFFHEYGVLSQPAFDFLYGASALPVNATQWGGTAVTGMPLPASNYAAPPSVTAIETQLSGTHGSGGWGGGSAPTVPQIAAAILANPSNLLVTDLTGRVTAGSVTDKSGYSLASTQSFNNAGQTTKLAATLAASDLSGKVAATVASGDGADSASLKTTVGAAGAGLTALGDARLANLDVPTSSRLPFSGYTAPPTTAAIASAILATPANLLGTDATGRVIAGTVADKAGYSLVASQSFNNAGQTTKLAATVAASDVSGNLPANAAQWGGVAVTGMPLLSANYIAADNGSIAAIKLKTDTLPTSPAATGDVQAGLSALGYTAARAAKLDNNDVAVSSRLSATSYSAAPSLASIASTILANPTYPIATDSLGRVTLAGYAAGQDPGSYLVTQGFNPARVSALDNLDAPVSSRLATSSYTPPISVNAIASAVLVSPANKLATNADGTVNVNLTQAVPLTNTAQSLGDALNAARAQGFGPWSLDANAKTLKLYASDGTTVVRTFALDSATSPTSRI